MPLPNDLQSFLCTHEDVTLECLAQRAPGRDISDFIVRCHDIKEPGVEYKFEMLMVRTPPRYTANSVKINKLPYEHGSASHSTKFIWLARDYEPEDAKFVFQRCIEAIVKHIKEQERNNERTV